MESGAPVDLVIVQKPSTHVGFKWGPGHEVVWFYLRRVDNSMYRYTMYNCTIPARLIIANSTETQSPYNVVAVAQCTDNS